MQTIYVMKMVTSKFNETISSNERLFKIGNSDVTVGRFSYLLNNLSVRQWGEGASLRIGSFCSLASSINIFLGGNHRVDWITTYPFGHIYIDELGGTEIKGHPSTYGDVEIGHDVWIGHSATIMSGIKISSGAVIAANSTVVKDVGPYEIVGGNPSIILKKRFDDNIIDLLLQLSWWDLPMDTIKKIAIDLSKPPTLELLNDMIIKYK